MNHKLLFATMAGSALVVAAGCGGSGTAQDRSASLKPCASAAISAATQVKLASLAPINGDAPAGPINVHVHIINQGINVSDGNIPQQWVDDQMEVLADAYASHGYTFNLANVTNTTNPAWFNMTPGSAEEAEAKLALRVGSAVDLNIYICNGAGTRGWSTYPWDVAGNLTNDGVVLYFNTLPGGSAPGFELGDTAVHEVGHWLGLYHTFENGCAKKFKGDQVRDTAYEESGATGCPVGRDTCNDRDPDPVTNYMDTTDDSCATNFTAGQKDRMDDMWTTYRNGN